MRHARPVQVSYSGRRLQTILFNHEDRDWLLENQAASVDLVRAARTQGSNPKTSVQGRWLFRTSTSRRSRSSSIEYAFHENAVELRRT